MFETADQLALKGVWAAAKAASSGVAIADMLLPDHPLVFVNPAFQKMTRYRSDEIIGLNCKFLQGPATGLVMVELLSTGLREGRNVNCRLLNYRKDGSTFWNDLTLSPIIDGGRTLVGLVAIKKDVTAEVELRRELATEVDVIAGIKNELKSANEKLRQIAYFDSIIGLPTRKLFYDRGGQSLARAKRSQELFAVIFMDLDGFKHVNDVLGHEAGDIALRQVAERISDQIRETDTLARVGGMSLFYWSIPR
jgi:PAS domain S-box-containing protein